MDLEKKFNNTSHDFQNCVTNKPKNYDKSNTIKLRASNSLTNWRSNKYRLPDQLYRRYVVFLFKESISKLK